MREGKRFPLQRSVATVYAGNALIYGFTGLYYCFIQLYLKNETAHSYSKIGFLLSFAQTVAIFAPMLWGVWADKARYKKTALFVMMAGAPACYCLVPVNDSFWWLILTLGLTMFFLSAIGSVLDVIGVETALMEGRRYGSMRLMGMLGYGFVAFGLSFFISGNYIAIFGISAMLGLICCLCIAFMPKVEGHAHAKKMRFAPLLKAKELLLLISILATAQFAYGYYMNFFPTYLTSELNAPDLLWGTNVLLTTVSEAPFYIWFDAIFKRFRMKTVVVFILVLTIVRYVLLAICVSFAGILMIGFVTGAASVSLLYSVNLYANKNIDPSLRASAQTMVYALGVGVPRMLSSFIGGFVTESIGVNCGMILSATVVAVGLGAALLSSFGDLKESKAQGEKEK